MNAKSNAWKILLLFAVLVARAPAQVIRPSIAVLPLTRLATISDEEANTLTQLLETGIVQSGRLQVVERRQIAAVLEEQRFSAEDYADDSVAAEIGRILSSEMIVIGTVSRIGVNLYIIAKIINVSTGAAMNAARVTAGSIEALAEHAEGLGKDLADMLVLAGAGDAATNSRVVPEPEAGIEAVATAEVDERPRLTPREYAVIQRRRTVGGWVLQGLGGVSAVGALFAFLGPADNQSADDDIPWNSVGIGLGVTAGLFSTIGALVWLERSELEDSY